jgi:hypothetical protein
MEEGTGSSCWSRWWCLFVFVEGKTGFMLNKPPSYCLPWSVPGGDGRIAGKALQIERGNVRKLIANKIDLTLFPPFSTEASWLHFLHFHQSSGVLDLPGSGRE